MAYDYNRAKELWDWMDQAQKQQYVQNNKNDANFQRFAQEYHNEMNSNWSGSSNGSTNQNNTVTTTEWTNTTTSNTNTSNSNNQNGTNWSYDPIYYRSENTWNTGNNNQGWSTLSDWKNGNGNFYGNTSFDKEEQFDKSMIGDDPWKITIQAGTGKTTGRPDYEDSSDVRINELTDNLNRYYQTNPEFFADRETFNRQFEYNQRMSDRQRATLDSYWKKAQDLSKASSYTNPNMVNTAFNSWDLTPWIMDAIKQNNPELYAQWQKQMQDELNARIVNLAVPRTATDTVEIWNDLVKKLWLEQWDPYKIYDNWVWRCEQLWVFNMNNQLSSYIEEMDSVKNERTRAIQRTMSQWQWKKSQALINAEVAKTSAIYDSRFADLQNQYQATYNQRQQNLAIANQSAQALQMQGQEDSRVFNNKLNALKFAMTADSYRTPEQQAGLRLQEEAIRNDLNLLNQSKKNDLDLYNKYATAKLQNQLEYELQDLDIDDPVQQKANLSRALDKYYEEYWDIIQRPKQQVVNDVLEYAKANWISVSEALKKNFIEPFTNKPEYQQAIADKYWMNPTQSIQNVWDKVALVTKYPNGKISYQILDDVYNPKYDIKKVNWRDYLVVDDWKWVPQLKYIGSDWTVLNYSSLAQWLQSFMSKYDDWEFYKDKWCWYFVNEFLTDIWDSWHVWSSWESKKTLCNNKDWNNIVPWSIVAYDSWATFQDKDGNTVNAGHVSIVAWVDLENNKLLLYDANAKWDGKVHYWEVNLDNSKLYWYYTPEVYKTAWSELPEYLSNANEYWFVDAMTWNYGQYIMWKLNNVSINRLWWDDILQKQINNWFAYLETKWKNKDWYVDWLEDLYENYLETWKVPASSYIWQLWWVSEFTKQAKAYWEAVWYWRYTKLNDKWYYDDLTNLYDEYIKSNKVPTEAQVQAYGWLDDFYKTAKAYSQSVWFRYTPEEQDKEIEDMRDKWETTQINKEMIDSIDALWKIQTMLKNWTSWYWDYTAVYLLNKLRDPDSVVREQEFSNTKNIWSIWDRINNYFQQIDSWKILNDSQKTQIYNEMNTLMRAKVEAYNNQLKAYRQKAIKWWDTSKIWNLYTLSKKWNISFWNLTWDILEPPHSDELN